MVTRAAWTAVRVSAALQEATLPLLTGDKPTRRRRAVIGGATLHVIEDALAALAAKALGALGVISALADVGAEVPLTRAALATVSLSATLDPLALTITTDIIARRQPRAALLVGAALDHARHAGALKADRVYGALSVGVAGAGLLADALDADLSIRASRVVAALKAALLITTHLTLRTLCVLGADRHVNLDAGARLARIARRAVSVLGTLHGLGAVLPQAQRAGAAVIVSLAAPVKRGATAAIDQ